MKPTRTIDVDGYIAGFPEGARALLTQMREAIRKAAPEAEEVISYQMPAYKLQGNLVYFAGYERHIGFYPTPSGIEAFKHELVAYKGAKGSVQFPLTQPLPLELIANIVKFKVAENLARSRAKTEVKPCARGHRFTKSSDCPTFPVCESLRKPAARFMSLLSAPARRALENAKIETLGQLAEHSEHEILALHGMGPGSIPKLRSALESEGLTFNAGTKKN